jgi:hypothetical protein
MNGKRKRQELEFDLPAGKIGAKPIITVLVVVIVIVVVIIIIIIIIIITIMGLYHRHISY